jgi:hypothetical protein
MRERLSRFCAWIRGRQGVAEDLAEEQNHLEMETEHCLDRGMAPEEARLAARRRFITLQLTLFAGWR